MRPQINSFFPYILLFILFGAAVLLRPILPVDETRYMTVAWEMYLHKNYFVPTLNFEPYHHKPPMLFWLINLVWSVTGVSRWTALIPVFAASVSVMLLTQRLTKKLYGSTAAAVVPWVTLGSVPFIIYSTLLMFDLMIAAFVLGGILVYLDHAERPAFFKPVIAGVILGLGLLTKGPVMLLYVLLPLALYPFWRTDSHKLSPSRLYPELLVSVLVSIIVVSAWLVPALYGRSDDFASSLLWKQTAGRISGNMNAAHARPVYFYLMVLPLMVMPWVFFPVIWKRLKGFFSRDRASTFLLCCVVPTFACFSLISGKQPHYLLPLFPFVAVVVAQCLSDRSRLLKGAALTMAVLAVSGQAIGSVTHLPDYDLSGAAKFYREHTDHDWAFVRNYQGELGYIARMEKPVQSLQRNDLSGWFKAHPDGYAFVRYSQKDDMSAYENLYSQAYRGKELGVFRLKKP